MTETIEALRHQCRRCREKLKTPVSNSLEAFCCKGCFRYYFAKKCLICEREKAGKGVACNHPKCRAELASKKRYGTRGKYVEKRIPGPSTTQRRDASKKPLKQGVGGAPQGPNRWRQIAGAPLTATEFRFATVPDGPNMSWIGGAYLRAETASRAALMKAGIHPLFTRSTPPLNVVGGYRFPGAPEVFTDDHERNAE
jgi:hypothetical protein